MLSSLATPVEPSDSLPLAIVIPWFDRGANGGAEMHAWQLANRLAGRGRSVEVLTTCCRSYQDDWATNHLPSGVEQMPEGFRVRRFAVESRRREDFDRINGLLLSLPRSDLVPGLPPVSSEGEAIFADELIKSPSLLHYLEAHVAEYQAFLFLPYLYGSTLRGLPLVAAKAILQPCLHDEAYAYLPIVFRAFFAAQKILFLSAGEAALAEKIYGPGILPKSIVAGAGVDQVTKDEDRCNIDRLHGAPYILCLGRQDAGKNTDLLARAFARFRDGHPDSNLHLIIAGPGEVRLPKNCPGLVNLGAIGEAQKLAVVRHCRALFHPSKNESYSRVIMEAWQERRPVAAHAECLATSTAVTAAGGGWLASSEQDWTALFAQVDALPADELAALGAAGERYAQELANWDRVTTRYEEAIWPPAEPPRPSSALAIHQVLPNFVYGDAISNHARYLRDTFRDLGHASDIYAWDAAPDVAHETRSLRECAPPTDSAIVYHHSIGTAVTNLVIGHLGPKCLVYHNITPAHFFAPYLPHHAQLAEQGRKQLPTLAPRFSVSVGDSSFNAIELAEAGFFEPEVLPICVDPQQWQVAPDPLVTRSLHDGCFNVLFVGRLCPNKKQEDLIYAFHLLKQQEPAIRLILVGSPVLPDDLYSRSLHTLVRRLGLEAHVIFTGRVSKAELVAYYRSAHLFWSMSEHEGFCVPLMEAMWFDVPVLAFASTAVPETLGGAGDTFTTKSDLPALVARAHTLLHDSATRTALLTRQRKRRLAFTPTGVHAAVQRLVHNLEPAAASTPSPPATIDPARVHRIAVVKLDHIGDLLLATPVFSALRDRFPHAHIAAIVAPSAAPVLANNPFVDQVVNYDAPWFWRDQPAGEKLAAKLAHNTAALRELTVEPYDLVVNLRSDHQNILFAAMLPHRNLASYTNHSDYAGLVTHPLLRTRAPHITEQHRELLASIGATRWSRPALYPTATDAAAVDAAHAFKSGTVALFTGAGISLKKWAAIKFRELAQRLRQQGIPMVVIGTHSEAELANTIAAETGAINLCEKLTLLQTAVALARCAALVSNDSAPVHLAAAVGTPVVVIIRPLVRNEFAPVGVGHRICCVSACANPCGGFDPSERHAHAATCACIQEITIDFVLAELQLLLDSA